MIDQLIQWDKALLVALNGSDSDFLDGIMWTITKTSTWIPLFACLFYAIVRNNKWRGTLLLIGMIVLLVTITDQFASGFCKPFFHRLRPAHSPDLASVIDLVRDYRCGSCGFISSHASDTFGVATFFMLLLRSRSATALMFLYACLSSYSRIYLGVHYPLDILCGALWGVLSGVFVHWLSRWLAARLSLPPLAADEACTVTGYRVKDLRPICWVFPLTMVYILIQAGLFMSNP